MSETEKVRYYAGTVYDFYMILQSIKQWLNDNMIKPIVEFSVEKQVLTVVFLDAFISTWEINVTSKKNTTDDALLTLAKGQL